MEIGAGTNTKAKYEGSKELEEPDGSIDGFEVVGQFGDSPLQLSFFFILYQEHIQYNMDQLIVVFVWLLIALLGISYIVIFLPALSKYVHFTSHKSMTLFIITSIIFTIDLILLLISYFRSTTTNPGNPSKSLAQNYNPSQLQQIKKEAAIQTEMKRLRRQRGIDPKEQIKLLNKVSYCFKCETIKPERCHHCKLCKKCILRMDHHCPWVGNCVGLHNHKFFILFLFYATLGTLIISLSIAIDHFSGATILSTLTSETRMVMYGVCIASGLLALAIGFLFVTQLQTSLDNLTTLESFTQGIEQNNPFDRGSMCENLSEIFGEGCWLLPTTPTFSHQDDSF